ncbi:GFA family protein [Neptunicella marina]|uniref:GFA family protein n=1 Tax=Neptunicella marina TaxID=2125989 RepID=A0A8J6IXM7_9ALTE|nr:GFA family protein [Neptunicella marina]MBC3767148.1 GFA family protein [Neptunicella marina]
MLGSCLCGSIQYRVNEFEPNIANCHCSMCRKSSGAAFATFAGVKPENFTWLKGESHIKVYESSEVAERGFCEKCGSSLFYKVKGNNTGYEIALGTLDEEPNHKPNANIYCSYKAQWPTNSEQLKEYKEGRG